MASLAFGSKEDINIKFVDLNVSVNEKDILKNISGEIKAGEIFAIMGPSGAGKSTLLNLLVGRETKGIVLNAGLITINGQNTSKTLRRKIGYVLQEDIFFSQLTVRQTLEFVGKVRLSDGMNWDEKQAVVDKVIDNLGLRKCENTVMGGDYFTHGCSGGEKKRCSIAVELISNPACIVMDEPTTGLDSSTALSLMKTLKMLAEKENRAICMTIHQPSSQMFHMFDKLMLMCDGRVMFYGKKSDVLPFFESIGMPSYPNWNPADFIMDKLKKIEVQSQIAEGFKAFQKNLPTQCESSHVASLTQYSSSRDNFNSYTNFSNDEINVEVNLANNQEQFTLQTHEKISDEKLSKLTDKAKWPTSYRTQVIALWKRSFTQAKSEILNTLYLTQAFLFSIITGLIWFNTPFEESSIRDREGSIFFVMVYLFTEMMFDAVFSFPYESKVIAKERAAGMYRLSAYYTVKNTVDLSIIIIPQYMIYIITYWMIGLNRSPIFLLGLINVFLITVLSQCFGLIIGGSIKNFKKSVVLTVLFTLGNMLLGGFYTKRMPTWLSWCRYVSVHTYFYNIFLRMEFEHAQQVFKCTPDSVFRECFYNNRSYITGPELIAYVNPIPLDIPQTIGVLVLAIFIFQIVLYYVLKNCNKMK